MNDLTPGDRAFLEMAKKGKLSARAELPTWHIAMLRFPNDGNARWRWLRELNSAIKSGKLPRPNNSTTIFHGSRDSIGGSLTITAYHVQKTAYREYLILQRLFGNPIPDDSLERCWITDLPPESPPVSLSDAALGKQHREQLQEFSKRGNQERQHDRAAEHDRWRKEAQRIQATSQQSLSKLELARRVKKTLSLPDTVGTIRRKV